MQQLLTQTFTSVTNIANNCPEADNPTRLLSPELLLQRLLMQ